jgi:hypothetical protein
MKEGFLPIDVRNKNIHVSAVGKTVMQSIMNHCSPRKLTCCSLFRPIRACPIWQHSDRISAFLNQLTDEDPTTRYLKQDVTGQTQASRGSVTMCKDCRKNSWHWLYEQCKTNPRTDSFALLALGMKWIDLTRSVLHVLSALCQQCGSLIKLLLFTGL